MTNTLNNLPEELKPILGAICRKWQADFTAKSTWRWDKMTKKDLELKRASDYAYIEKLTEAIEKLNWWKLYTAKWIENL